MDRQLLLLIAIVLMVMPTMFLIASVKNPSMLFLFGGIFWLVGLGIALYVAFSFEKEEG